MSRTSLNFLFCFQAWNLNDLKILLLSKFNGIAVSGDFSFMLKMEEYLLWHFCLHILIISQNEKSNTFFLT